MDLALDRSVVGGDDSDDVREVSLLTAEAAAAAALLEATV